MSVEALRTEPRRINTPATSGDRLWNDLVATARFGGTDKGGVTRLTLTEEDRAVRGWFVGECRALGCTVEVDGIGNIFATYPGEDMSLPAIAVGSHLDTQPQGGRFDGILGVLAGVEVLRTLKDTSTLLRHPLTVVNWTNEEGSRFSPAMMGSGVFTGALSLDAAHALADREGVTVSAALDTIGYRGEANVGPAAFAAYLELHIEQGPLLEASATEIGVVTGVQGVRWFDVTISGTEAHAGSTPMAQRDDALVAAAQIVLSVRDIARQNPPGVGTVGFAEVGPNSRNVVPGSVRLQIDMRHPSETGLDQMQAALEDAVRNAGAGTALKHIWSKVPVVFDPAIVEAVRDSAEALGYSATDVVSGAGHDAAHIATVTPTAMIFVPSKDGLSHNEAEYTSPEECARGVEVLFQTILELDRR
ncbi:MULTISPECIES: Zn-dependent hydrolase [unclassified Ensifer]|uniref:Zn-dependent hydrolase n=1 Tax=unclassified Ensifer TaxID=2633371 RepID=UPI000813AA79|nr:MULTISPECIES: Zn-dependent hydrolase [unclassified Ensifer]OCO99228.1 Zn-dependent hydrolase [Ensifer sp. LC11]OCO99436.1 Zn-dependent hydrolase [Ensifer sp. LC13]OCP14414.1 Zn-dependent hydrolase [Ensifer sp. LC14]OCP29526.1 Zn-dependent hydrolase [Ensifer sp. LC499]